MCTAVAVFSSGATGCGAVGTSRGVISFLLCTCSSSLGLKWGSSGGLAQVWVEPMERNGAGMVFIHINFKPNRDQSFI